MTVKEFYERKYQEQVAKFTERQMLRVVEEAANHKMSTHEYIMRNLEITEHECNPRKNAEVYWELIQLNKDKLVASNRHRQYHGKVDAFWLTKKGYKTLGFTS